MYTLYLGGVRHQQPPKPALTISTVDRYQGDENDIVILSLVRVKPGNRFVSLLNRFIVASSRARLGFYIVGSKSAVSELVPNTNTLKGPKHWLKLLEHLSHSDPSKLPSTTSASPESSISSTMKVHIASVGHEDLDGYLKSRIGPALPVCCPQHRCQSRLDVPSIASQRVFPNESNWTTFCNEKCTSQLRCGHLCNKGCHIFNPWEHERQCQEVVYSTCPSHKIPMACLDIIRFQTNHMKRVEDIFTHPDSKWKCCHEVKVSQPHCGHKLVLPCHEYMACENGSQALPKCEVIVEDFRLSCGHVIKGPPCWAYHEYLRGSLPKCNEMVTVRKDCNLHVVQVACHAVDEENRKICKQMIFNFSRPRCHHEISMTCMDARTLSHLWKSHNYIACQQVTSSIDGKGQQSELMESLTYGPSELCLMPSQVKQKCRKNVSIKRSCKHLLVQECDQGFQHVNDKTMPKCEQMVTISCPMCAQMTFSVPCHQSKLYEEISTKGFQMLQASQGSLENYLDILKTDILQYEDTGTGRMFLSVLLSSECKHVLDFHQNSCEHPQSFRCSELLGIVVNKESIPPCQGDIQRALPCGHQVQAKCYERTASYPKCTQPSPPFQFPTCTHSITVKTCAKLMHLQQRLDEGSLHCQSLVTLKLSRCGHEVDVACGKMNHARKLIRDGPSLVNNKVVESIAYCVPCVDAPKCTAVVEFERDCGHCEAKVMCQEAFTWAKDAIPKSHPSLCRQDCQVQHPLCGHEKHIPCWMSKSFVSWNPWKESRRKDWMRWVELPLQLNSSPSAEASPLVQHFIYPPNVLTCEQGIVAMSTYPHINAANEELCTEEKRMFQTCNEVIQVVFESCGHSTALSCGEFCMASFGPRLGLVTSGLVCKERVELQCHAGHSQWLSCHESTQAMDNIDKMCNFSVDKLCTQCQINVVKSKCSEQKIFCEREVQTTLKCGHKVSWKCSSQHKQNDPRPSFQPQHQIYSNCMECVQDLWDREKDIEIDLPTMRDYCLKGIKKVVGNDQPLHEVFPEDPIPIEIDHIFTTMYEQARIDIISTFQNAMLQTNNKEYEFPIAWDCEEEVRNQKYVSNNYDLVFLKCDLGKQPDPKLIHQRRFDAKDTICGRSLEVQRLTKDALLELATGGEVKIAVALAFRVQGQQLPNGFITQIDLEKPGMIVHANKHRIKLEKEGYDHIEITTTTESSSMMYFWQPKAVVPLFIVRLKLHANCSTCFEDFANDRKYGAICGTNHFMCWDCFGNYIEASKAADAINGYVDSQGKLVCPDPECKKHQKTFDINLIRSSSPKSVFDELLNLQIEFEKTKAVKEAVKEEQKKQNMEIERIRAMDEEERKLYYLRNKIIEDILTPRCPRCKMAYFEFTGCFALTCANKSCNAGFCAWCEQDCGEDAHSHVVHCTFGTTKNVFGDLKQLEIVRNRRRKEAIEKLLNQENIDTKKKVLGRMKKEFDDLGLQIK